MDDARCLPAMPGVGLVKRTSDPRKPHSAFIRRDHSGDNLDQCALARAILAKQRMHLAPSEVQRNLIQRLDAGKAFGNPGKLQNRSI